MAFAAPGPPVRDLVRGPLLSPTDRKVYLDWLRGVAVIVMVMAHVTDAWTRDVDRQGGFYRQVVFVAGLAAPLFLFLAGLTLSLAASLRSASIGHAGAARLALTRGAQVLALAFLFRLQSQLLGWGPLSNFLKVDILNIMGLAMLAAALLWRVSDARVTRLVLFAVATTAVTMTTPLIREAGVLALLPDPIEAYIRPLPGLTSFALFPWAAFLLAGAIAGEVIHAARTRAQEIRLHWSLLAAGVAGIGFGYAASFQASIYPVANFWTSSPTFFFIRLGICTVMIPVARAIVLYQEAQPRWLGGYHSTSPPIVATLGRSSLFVYWIHVEMVYGLLARPLRRALPIGWALVATAALCVLLFLIVRWKDRLMAGVKLTGPFRIFAPVLK
ncbi:MAG: heparan-alpha-glucosaminide N-acetyltransferase domain-containing protein [Acidobacteriota bacterium]|nr:heparan-alpha-glucosaminide N-acetyltransferase domain-containing protein [Acidobacteriota bacterium]